MIIPAIPTPKDALRIQTQSGMCIKFLNYEALYSTLKVNTF